jgi:ADP-ribose pyrophosphatase
MTQRTLSSDTVFAGGVFSIHRDRVRLPHGPEVRMEVVRHPASVVLIPMPDPDHIVLVRQYRYAIDQWIWELPAGSVDPGETADQAAVRECHEEIGRIPTRVKRLGAFYPTPGYCDELMVFFKLTGLEKPEHEAATDEDEDIEARIFTLAEARKLVEGGTSPDMKTAFGLTLL